MSGSDAVAKYISSRKLAFLNPFAAETCCPSRDAARLMLCRRQTATALQTLRFHDRHRVALAPGTVPRKEHRERRDTKA